ncbi:SWIM zinc finger family protein [Neobacillus terrae]|uniref:SWIM zinc finger family protein n=1 Tax=Neobacillus terrae TaxID=3034837 RepID=UPI001FB10277|nr:SWIM zinc finger family protein [Neobacillus terrae]
MSMPASGYVRAMSEWVMEKLRPEAEEDARLVQKGLMLYRQGLVKIDWIDEDEVKATVQDVMPAKVVLDLTFLDMSSCSCPGDDLCRHQLSVFFSVYSREASVAAWMDTWRRPVKEKNVLTTLGIQKAKDLIKANGILKPDYTRWIESFEESFKEIVLSKNSSNLYIVAELFKIYMRRIRAGAPIEQEWKLLYELVASVYSFRRLAELCGEMGPAGTSLRETYENMFSQLLDEAESLVHRLGVQAMPFAFDEFIEKLKDEAFSLLAPNDDLVYERIYLYRLLWTHLFKKKSWREDELEKIRVSFENVLDWQNPLPLMIAGVHINFVLQRDEKALGLIEAIKGTEAVPYLLYWINWFTSQKAWDRAEPVVELFIQKIKRYMDELNYYGTMSFTKMSLKAISPFCEATDRQDLYERAMLQMMPFSYREYERQLFEQGQYEKWGELQAFLGYDLDQLPSERLKVIEKEMPEVLMSLLHQNAQQQIDLKNRQSYRRAVRRLKKLRTMYKKQKRLDDWQFFFDSLLERTKRLRAFQEECQRSKLIDA